MEQPSAVMPSRQPGIDLMRVSSAMLRCIVHGAVPYLVVRTGMWPIKDDNTSNLLPDVIVFNIHSFIMENFFFVAGFVAAVQVSHKSWPVFMRNRVRKILIPFLTGLLVLMPYIFLLFPIGKTLEQGFFNWQWPTWSAAALVNLRDYFYPLGHLWFLYYLIFYYIAWSLARYVFGLNCALSRWLHDFMEWPLMAYLWGIAISASACMVFSEAWYILNPLTTTIEWESFIYFLLFFALGVTAFHRSELWTFAIQRRWPFTIGFLVLMFLCTGCQYFSKLYQHPWHQTAHLGAILLNPLHTICGVMASIGWAMVLGEKCGPWLRYLSDSAYWVYLVHLPLVMTLHLALYNVPCPLFLKFMLAMVVSLTVALFTYKWFGKKWLS